MSKKGEKCKSARCGKKLAATGGQLNCLRQLYFDFVKVIFWLAAEVKVNPQLARRANITVEDNITA